jgi:ribosomal protein S8
MVNNIVNDLCTRLQWMVRHNIHVCVVRNTKLVRQILRKLVERGYLEEFHFYDASKYDFWIRAKRTKAGVPVFSDVCVGMRSHLNFYAQARFLRSKFFTFDILLSTSEGLLWKDEAIDRNVGGWVILTIG